MKPSVELEMPGTQIPGAKKKIGARSNYYVIISVWALFIVLSGFALTYFQPLIKGGASFRPLVHLHGFLYFLWMIMFIAQPLLVRLGYTHLHKKIGVAGLVLAGLMIIVGVVASITGAKLNSPTLIVGGYTAKQFLIVPMTDMFLLTTFFIAVLLNLKNSQSHKRLIVLMTLSVLPAAVGRVTGIFGITNIFLGLLIQHGILYSGIIYDLIKTKRVHPVYLWGGLLLVVVHLMRFPLGASAWWAAVANWLVD